MTISRSRWRLGLFFALFVALAAAGIAWGVRAGGVKPGDLGALAHLPIGSLAILAALTIAHYGADMLRYRALGRAVGDPVGWHTAFEASAANSFFGLITPGAALGAPAAIVMLARRGVSWDGATLIAFGKSMTSMVVMVGLAFIAIALGFGPGLDGAARAAFASGLGMAAAFLLVPILGAIWPAWMIRRIDRFEAWLGRRRRLGGPRAARALVRVAELLRSTVRRLAHLRDGGAAMPLVILASHLIYLAVFIAVGVVLARGFGAASLPRAIGCVTVYCAFTYVAPTPGGAGLSEGLATSFFGTILPAREAVVVVILFRGLTFYLQILVGAIYLAVVGGLRAILDKPVTA